MFEREARGLKALRDTVPETLGVPEVVRASSRGLMLEWIEEGGRTFTSEADLGNSLAELHQVPQPHFGGIDGGRLGFSWLGGGRSNADAVVAGLLCV